MLWVSKFFVPKDTKDGVWRSIAYCKNWTVCIWKRTFRFASLVAGVTFSQSVSQDISKVSGVWIAKTDGFSLIRAISICWKEQLESFGCPKANVHVLFPARSAWLLCDTRPHRRCLQVWLSVPGHPFLDVTVSVPVALLNCSEVIHPKALCEGAPVFP